MLCPVCRRMVGKDGFCPQGHEIASTPARKEQQTPRPPTPPSTPAATYAPAPAHTAAEIPAAVALDSIEVPPPVPGGPALPASPPGKPRKALAIGLSLALVAVGAIGWVTLGPGGSAGASNLKRVFTSGESNRYSLAISMRGTYPLVGFPIDTGFDMEVEERTLSVDGDGVARVRFAVENVNAIANGTVVPVPDDARISFTVRTAPDGRILDHDEEGTLSKLADVNPLVGMFGPEALGPLFPNRKVAPGATWTVEQSQGWPLTDQRFTTTLNNTLLEQKTLAGEAVSVIKTDMRMPVNLRVKFVELLAEIEKQTGEKLNLPVPGDVGFTMNGLVTGGLTQTVAARTGILTAVIGTMSIRGTIGFFGPDAPGDMVFNVDVDVTMTRKPADAI
jgi:hypothetical protein